MKKRTIIIIAIVVILGLLLLNSIGVINLTGQASYSLPSNVCVDSDLTTIKDRTVTDNSYMVKGSVTYSNNYGKANQTAEDYCNEGGTRVRELYCYKGLKQEALMIDCPNGCVDGACVA